MLCFLLIRRVTNLSSCRLTSDQLDILKFGLTNSICPPRINKSDVFVCFELIHDPMVKKLKDKKQNPKLVSALSHLAHSYSLAHRPTIADLKSYKLLKDLRKNKNIIILKPDKGNGVVVLDRTAYESGILKIISNTSKFKVLAEDPTLLRERQLQRFLRKLKSTGHLDVDTYFKIYPTGSQPARIYGLPKMHKRRGLDLIPPLRPIVSSIGMYNYELAKSFVAFFNPTYHLITILRTISLLLVKSKNCACQVNLWFLLMLKAYLPTFL